MMVHFLAQIMVLGLIGTVGGMLLGAVSTLAVLPILGGYLSILLPPAVFPLPLLTAAAFGLVIAFVFAYLPLVAASQLKPATLFRAAGGSGGGRLRLRALLHPSVGGPLLLGIAALIGLALLVTREPLLVLWYSVGAVGCLPCPARGGLGSAACGQAAAAGQSKYGAHGSAEHLPARLTHADGRPVARPRPDADAEHRPDRGQCPRPAPRGGRLDSSLLRADEPEQGRTAAADGVCERRSPSDIADLHAAACAASSASSTARRSRI